MEKNDPKKECSGQGAQPGSQEKHCSKPIAHWCYTATRTFRTEHPTSSAKMQATGGGGGPVRLTSHPAVSAVPCSFHLSKSNLQPSHWKSHRRNLFDLTQDECRIAIATASLTCIMRRHFEI